MPNEWIPVVSDAVKIGLGAVVGGVFAIGGAIKAHRLKQSEEYTRRCRDGLQQISQEFDAIAIVGTARVAALIVIYESYKDDGSGYLYSAIDKELGDAYPLTRCVKDLHSIETRLALYSFPEIAKAIEVYRLTLCKMHQEISGAHDESRFADYSDWLHREQSEVLSLLATAYKNA
jgi:hypothetical protein